MFEEAEMKTLESAGYYTTTTGSAPRQTGREEHTTCAHYSGGVLHVKAMRNKRKKNATVKEDVR
jgi:hypothetical protein